MITARHDEVATCIDFYDSTEREFVLSHFPPSGLAFLFLRDTRQRQLRIGPHLAGELAFVFDHFSRHQQLPRTIPEPDYMI